MQEPQRILARLNPISIDPCNLSRTTGGILQAEDVAAALAGLRRGPYLLLRYIWGDDKTVTKELHILLMTEIIQLSQEENWPCRNNLSRLHALVKTALFDLERSSLCKQCHGTGIKLNEPCYYCNGSGKRKRTQSEYARLCGVKPSNWKRYWAVRFHETYLLITEWNEEGMTHLLSRLRTTIDEV